MSEERKPVLQRESDSPIRNPTLDAHKPAVPGRPAIFSGPVDAALLLAEWSFRQVYWRNEWLRNLVKRRRSRKPIVRQIAERAALIDYLKKIGVNDGALVMAHTSVSGLSFDSAESGSGNSLKVANELVSVLLQLIGETGTLVMPTHPIYKTRANSAEAASTTPVYNPQSTPSGVGLANELFWRRPGTQRSLYPHNTLAAKGPLADELLRDNLTGLKPLPHGIESGYHRFCRRNGLLISVGVPLASCFTLVHTAEEARDDQWSVPDFFEERQYVVRHNGEDKPVTIRKTRTEFMMFSLCIRKLRRDLVGAGILHEGHVGTVRIDWAHSGELFQFISDRNRTSAYPYFGTALVARKGRSNAAA